MGQGLRDMHCCVSKVRLEVAEKRIVKKQEKERRKEEKREKKKENYILW